MKLETKTEMVPIDRLRGFYRDRGITPARLIAAGFDARSAERRVRGTVEIQYLAHCAGETPRRIQELDVAHRPELAYLWNIQCRNGRAVLEGDPELARVVGSPEFAQAYLALAELLGGGTAVHGEIFLVGNSTDPYAWDASGSGFTEIFGEESRCRFLRIRKHDLLFAEEERLIAAPFSALAALTAAKTRTVFAANAPITMLSKVYGWMGTRIVVSSGCEQTVLELGENAASSATKAVVTKRASGAGLFLGNTDPGRGLKALTSLERDSRGGWRLSVYPVEGTNAPAIMQT